MKRGPVRLRVLPPQLSPCAFANRSLFSYYAFVVTDQIET